jgi:hypothetical protein
MQTAMMILLGMGLLSLLAALRICKEWAKQSRAEEAAEKEYRAYVRELEGPPMTQAEMDELNRARW